MADFILANWFSLVQSIGIIATLLLTTTMLRRQMNQTRVSNSLLVTQHHREIWSLTFENDALKRVFDKEADIQATPITEQERMFVNLIFLHMSASFKAIQAQAIYPVDGMAEDLIDILSHPIPFQVWSDMKPYHDKIFVNFVNRYSKRITVEPTNLSTANPLTTGSNVKDASAVTKVSATPPISPSIPVEQVVEPKPTSESVRKRALGRTNKTEKSTIMKPTKQSVKQQLPIEIVQSINHQSLPSDDHIVIQ